MTTQWQVTLELLRRRPFEHVLIENVPNWRHLHGGRYMAEVLDALERLGYKWAYRTIDALAFGLPQRRHRIFLFATMSGDPRNVLFHGDVAPALTESGLSEKAHGFYWTEGNRGLGWGDNCVPTLKGGSGMGIPSPPAIILPDLSIVTPHIEDAERLQGFEAGWTEGEVAVEAGSTRPFNGRRRWMLVGNAVNVGASEWIGEKLRFRRHFEGDEGRPLGPAWPSSAWYDGEIRRDGCRGPWPENRERIDLADFLIHPGTPLSLRATSGFYGRICGSSLRFKSGFKEAILAHKDRMKEPHGTRVRFDPSCIALTAAE